MPHQLVGRNADEARRQPALRREDRFGAVSKRTDGRRDRDVLGKVEIMHAFCARDFCNRQIAIIGQAGDDGCRIVLTHVFGECRLVACVEVERYHGVQSMGAGHVGGHAGS